MGAGSTSKTDLYSLYDYVQNTLVVHPKEVFIETLRNYFEQDSYYHYSRDEWGFPNIGDHTDLPLDAGLDDDVTSRLYIGELYRYDVQYYPSIFVKYGSGKSFPISMSRNKGLVGWSPTVYVDGYGNESLLQTPSYYIQSGGWEGSIIIDIETKSMRSRDELVEIVSLFPTDESYEMLTNTGVIIKSGSPSIGSPSEIDDRNDKIFKQSLTFDILSEWRRHIPVTNVVDAINFCIEFGNLENDPAEIAPNLSIVTVVDVIEAYSIL